jgi:hypothetical protein
MPSAPLKFIPCFIRDGNNKLKHYPSSVELDAQSKSGYLLAVCNSSLWDSIYFSTTAMLAAFVQSHRGQKLLAINVGFLPGEVNPLTMSNIFHSTISSCRIDRHGQGTISRIL